MSSMSSESMLPWLSSPVMLHSNREKSACTMTPEQCALISGWWVSWYQGDLHYALPTVAFFLVAIVLFSLAHITSLIVPRSFKRTRIWSCFTAGVRVLSYRKWSILGSNTLSIGGLLLAAVGVIYFFSMMLGPRPYYWPNTHEVSYGDSPPIANRSGWMALACLPFLLLLGAKANPITALTGIAPEKLAVWHQLTAWVMFVLALVHTFPFIVYHIWSGDIVMQWNSGGQWVTGVVAIIAQAWLVFMSIPWIRNRYYEFFKATHFIAALVFVVFFFFHCDFRLSSWDYFIAGSVLYSLCLCYSVCKMLFEHGLLKARLECDSEQTVKITIDTVAQWRPGQYIFLRFLSGGLNMLSTHPFTICSISRADKINQMVFHVRARGGFTGRLMTLAKKQPGVSIPVLLDGPYGGLSNQKLASLEQPLVIGGGAGAGYTLALIENVVHNLETKTAAVEKMKVILATRDPGMRQWYTEAVREIVGRHSSEKAPFKLSIDIHETYPQPADAKTENSSSSEVDTEAKLNSSDLLITGDDKITVTGGGRGEGGGEGLDINFFSGRPDLSQKVQNFVAQESNTIGVIVCGPSTMCHDVSQAVSTAQPKIINGQISASEVWFHQESFSY